MLSHVKKPPLTYFILSLLVLLVDQATKLAIVRYVPPYRGIEVLPFLQIVNVRNPGAAFGLFQDLGNTVFLVIAIVAIAIVSSMIVRGREDRLPLAFILGGALGNFTDRIRLGHVVDFIDLYVGRHHWPAFNVADSSLTLGMALLLYRLVARNRQSLTPR